MRNSVLSNYSTSLINGPTIRKSESKMLKRLDYSVKFII